VLTDRVAVVTGASRGAGRGIALALGEAGATVYVTGRSQRTAGTTDNRPETIEETAELVTARGGRGTPVRCDHTREEEVNRLFAQVAAEQGGRLDLLVNSVWGGSEDREQPSRGRFWERPWQWHGMMEAGVATYLRAARHAVRLMLPQRSGLIVNITYDNRGEVLSNVFYDMAMQSINRLAYAMASELRPEGIASVALSPGFMRTERVTDWGVPPELLAQTESTEYVGRAVVALLRDPQVIDRSGRLLHVGDLAREYGLTDIDGRWIPPYSHG
jgi:NAD(P)-dependent dehydrogenase (short-subunit alcohol dehydrogenase family)